MNDRMNLESERIPWVYEIPLDGEDELDPPFDDNSQELFASISIQAPDTAIDAATSKDNDEQCLSEPAQQDRLADRQLQEGESVDPGEMKTIASDVATSTWHRALKLDTLLDYYAQAEGEWMRKKMDHSDMGPSSNNMTKPPDITDITESHGEHISGFIAIAMVNLITLSKYCFSGLVTFQDSSPQLVIQSESEQRLKRGHALDQAQM